MLRQKKLVMGFGHRIYKAGDPRNAVFKVLVHFSHDITICFCFYRWWNSLMGSLIVKGALEEIV